MSSAAAAISIEEDLFSNPCSDFQAAVDQATRNSTSTELLQQNQVHNGIEIQQSDGTITFQSGTTISMKIPEVDKETRFCCIDSSESGSQVVLNKLPIPSIIIDRIGIASLTAAAARGKITEIASVVKSNNLSDVITQLFKTENFVTWLTSSIDRLHDMREFEPASVVRALLFENFMQDFIVLDDTLKISYLKLLSEFLERALGGGFWGTNSGNELTFASYVQNGGPALEATDDYTFPIKPGMMNEEKKKLINQVVIDLKLLGIPLVRIIDPGPLPQSAPPPELKVQAIQNINIQTEGSDLEDGTLATFANLVPNQIRELFLHFRGMTAKDQKYVNIAGSNVLLLLDAYKKPFRHQQGAFQTTPNTYISAIDKANAKKWTPEKYTNIQAISQDARQILLPEPGQLRRFKFTRCDTKIQTEQTATVQPRQITNRSMYIRSVTNTIISVQQQLIAAGHPNEWFNAQVPLDYRMQCRAFDQMWSIQENLQDIVTLDLNGNPVSDNTKTKKYRKEIVRDYNKLNKMCKALDMRPKIDDDDHEGHYDALPSLEELDEEADGGTDGSELRDMWLLGTIDQPGPALAILNASPSIIKVEKSNIPDDDDIGSLKNVTNCDDFYMVQVVEEEETGIVYISTSTGSYKPLTCLLTLRPSIPTESYLYDIEGISYIPLASVMKLEQQILTVVARDTTRQLLADPGEVGQITVQLANYIRTNANSLSFLSKEYQTAFLQEVSHHELGMYNASPGQKPGVYGLPQSVKTATVAGHIFEPSSHVGVVRRGVNIERIDSSPEDGAPPTLTERIKGMDNEHILTSILVATMSIGEEKNLDDVNTYVAPKIESIFITINRAIIKTLVSVFDKLSEMDETQAYKQQLTQLYNVTIGNLTNKGTTNGMFQLVTSMCANLVKDESMGHMNFLDYLSDTLSDNIIRELTPVSEILAQAEIGKEDLTDILRDNLQEHFDNTTIEELCQKFPPLQGGFNKEWDKYEESRIVSHSTEDDPYVEFETSWIFGRRFLNAGRDEAEEVPLLLDVIDNMDNADTRPQVHLSSKIYPNPLLGGGMVEQMSTNAVSVAQVHRVKFGFYMELFNAFLPNLSRTGLFNFIFILWQKRMISDEGVNPEVLTMKLFKQTIQDAKKRMFDTQGDLGDDGEGDDDDEEGGTPTRTLDGLTSSTKIGFSRSLNGISDIVGKFDKSQRCLQYTIKSIAYSVIPLSLEISSTSVSPPLTQDQSQAALTFCAKVRAYEGLKSSGDLLPLLVSRSMNLCYGFQRDQFGVPSTSIFGGASFDKLCVLLGHLHLVPDVMIDVKGGILCIGGFRGRARGGQNRNLVTLENNRTLVQQLNLQVASCDSYWIGSMPGEAHSRQNTARTMHLLVLLLAQVYQTQGRLAQFVGEFQKFTGDLRSFIIIAIKQLGAREGNIPIITQINQVIEGYNQYLQSSLTYSCSNSQIILQRLTIQSYLRTAAVKTLQNIFGSAANVEDALTQLIEYAKKLTPITNVTSQPAIMSPQEVMVQPQQMMAQPQQVMVQPQQVMAQPQQAIGSDQALQQRYEESQKRIEALQEELERQKALLQSREQQAQAAQDNQDTQVAEKLRAEATAERQRIRANLNLLMEQFLAPGNLYNLMVLSAPRGKGEIPNQQIFNPVVFGAVLRTWRSIENIRRNEGNWSLLTQSQRDKYHKIQFMLSAFASYSGVDPNTEGIKGGGSKKKRKRKRKTRRKKKKRKKKTIKRRRKKGRKTRRK